MAVAGGGGEGHGVGVGDFGIEGELEPCVEQVEGVVGEVGAVEAVGVVVDAEFGEVWFFVFHGCVLVFVQVLAKHIRPWASLV